MAKQSQDLVPSKKTAAPVPTLYHQGQAVELPGLEAFTPDQLQLSPPRIRIIHKKDRRDQVGEPGQFLLGDTAYDVLTIVGIRAHPMRLLAEGEDRDAKIVCASVNGREPAAAVQQPRSASCRRCSYGQWSTNPLTNKRIQPPCQEGIAILGLVPALDDRPVWLICSKTARQPAREFLMSVSSAITEGRAAGLSSFVIELTTAEKRNGGIIWYVPVFNARIDTSIDYSEAMQAARDMDICYLPRLAEGELDDEPGEHVVPVQPEETLPPGDDIPF